MPAKIENATKRSAKKPKYVRLINYNYMKEIESKEKKVWFRQFTLLNHTFYDYLRLCLNCELLQKFHTNTWAVGRNGNLAVHNLDTIKAVVGNEPVAVEVSPVAEW